MTQKKDFHILICLLIANWYKLICKLVSQSLSYISWWNLGKVCLFAARSTHVESAQIGSLYHIAAIGTVRNQHLTNFVK